MSATEEDLRPSSDDAAPGDGPLTGVRVLELGSLIAGPFAGRLMADWGAEVTKIESPHRPDPFRTWGSAALRGQQVWWLVQSRNKLSATIDLATPEGRDRLLDLAEDSDVLLENFRPGTLEKWGLGPDQLWARNPGLIIGRVSAFGQTGSRSSKPGYAAVAEAMGGMRYLNGYPGQAPPRTGLSLGDSLASLFALQGILAALYWRDARGGTGQLIDTSLVESCFAMLESTLPDYMAGGVVRGPSGSGLKGVAPSNVFASADGKWVIIAANQDTVFERLARVMGRPDLPSDPRFRDHRARAEHQGEIESMVADWASGIPSEHLMTTLDEAGVPHGLLYSIADIVADPMFAERDMMLTVESEVGEVTMPGIVPRLSATPGSVRWAGRVTPGHDNELVERRLDAIRTGRTS